MPAWVSTGADDCSLPRLESPIALQIAYSLMERTVEGELVAMAQDTHATAVRGETSCASAAINEQFDAVAKLGSSDARKSAALATSLDSPYGPSGW